MNNFKEITLHGSEELQRQRVRTLDKVANQLLDKDPVAFVQLMNMKDEMERQLTDLAVNRMIEEV